MNRTAVITGGSRGIGEALAYEFARARFSIIITYRNEAQLAQGVVQRCIELGAVAAHAQPLDLTNDESVRICAREILRQFGSVGVLVNNAGSKISAKLSEQSFEQIDEQLRASLAGPMKLTSLLLPAVRGVIINVGSNLARIGKKNLSGYSAAKFGIRGMTQALAKERPDIKILALHPGLTATSMGGREGAAPAAVARVIYRFAISANGPASGSDIWVQDYLPGFWRSPSRLWRRFVNLLP